MWGFKNERLIQIINYITKNEVFNVNFEHICRYQEISYCESAWIEYDVVRFESRHTINSYSYCRYSENSMFKSNYETDEDLLIKLEALLILHNIEVKDDLSTL